MPILLATGGVHRQDAAVQWAIVLQYNPDILSRTLQALCACAESGDHSEAPRFNGATVETSRPEANHSIPCPARNPKRSVCKWLEV